MWRWKEGIAVKHSIEQQCFMGRASGWPTLDVYRNCLQKPELKPILGTQTKRAANQVRAFRGSN